METTKLQKLLAQAGICSRRSAEEMIREGKVTVNGKKAALGMRVDGTEEIIFNGKRIDTPEQKAYYILNKPAGFITTMDEQFGRRALPELISTIRERVYPVGRLDMDSEGLLLLTNDGDLTLRLTHPRYHIEKTYIVEIKGCITEQELNALTAMTVLDGEPIKPVRATIIKADKNTTVIDMRLTEGKNRQIRRMCCQCFAKDKHIVSLTRTAIGTLRIGDLEKGKYRPLKPEEIKYLKDCTNDKNNPDTRTERKA